MHDIMGHPLEVGTKVLTPEHYGVSYTQIATIVKVTRVAVYVDLYCSHWDRQKGDIVVGVRALRRRPDQMVAIGAQYEYNQKNFPENMI